MNPMINMIVMLEKELDGENQGRRRSARYVGDLRQMSDPRWHRETGMPARETAASLEMGGLSTETTHRSSLAQLFRLPRAQRQPECSDCQA